jgi:hypothetical protein
VVTPQHEIRFTIAAWFNPDFSWAKEKSKEGKHANYLLMHQQYHFNLTELYARKIRQVLSGLELTDSTYKNEIAQLFKKFHELYRQQKKKYDEETEHNTNWTMQYNWAASIDDEIKALSAYSDTLVVVKLK